MLLTLENQRVLDAICRTDFVSFTQKGLSHLVADGGVPHELSDRSAWPIIWNWCAEVEDQAADYQLAASII